MTCHNCRHVEQAKAANRTILICARKTGCKGKFHVVQADDTCDNFESAHTPPPPPPDGAKLIPLTQGKFAVVDAEDYDRLIKYKWFCNAQGKRSYARRNHPTNGSKIAMHREIMHAPKGTLVDHIDGNCINNRKSNLRLCSPAQNAYNRRPDKNCYSGYKGVTWHKTQKRWHVRITKAGKGYHLGSFKDPIEAAVAYDRAAEKLFGEFAYLNFPALKQFRKHARKIIFGK